MTGTHAVADNQESGGFLSSTFALAAAGTVAGALGFFTAPLTLGLGAVAAIAGVGLLAEGGGNVALTAAIVAAATTLITGLPMEFLSEAIVFPWAHETAFGAEVMNATGSFLVPIYDTIGEFFGITPFGGEIADVPVVDL